MELSMKLMKDGGMPPTLNPNANPHSPVRPRAALRGYLHLPRSDILPSLAQENVKMAQEMMTKLTPEEQRVRGRKGGGGICRNLFTGWQLIISLHVYRK